MSMSFPIPTSAPDDIKKSATDAMKAGLHTCEKKRQNEMHDMRITQ